MRPIARVVLTVTGSVDGGSYSNYKSDRLGSAVRSLLFVLSRL